MTGAFLFDLDGTLIDSRRSIAAACNHALTSRGRPALPEETVAGFVGDGARSLLMRAILMIAVFAIAAPDRPDPTPKVSRPVQEQILGDWLQVKRVIGGNEQPNPNELTMTVTPMNIQHVHLRNGAKEPGFMFPYSLDTTKNPVVISFRASQYEGILKIEGDLLTICYSPAGEPQRPSGFASPPNTRITLLQLTRIKQ